MGLTICTLSDEAETLVCLRLIIEGRKRSAAGQYHLCSEKLAAIHRGLSRHDGKNVLIVTHLVLFDPIAELRGLSVLKDYRVEEARFVSPSTFKCERIRDRSFENCPQNSNKRNIPLLRCMIARRE